MRLTAVLIAGALIGLELSASAESKVIYLQPLGKALPAEDIALVEESVKEFYGHPVEILPSVALPKEAWYAPRQRYRAEKLNTWLSAHAPPSTFRILGITMEDISTTKGDYVDWGLMGLATMEGPAAVISTFRCRKKARDPLQARQRFAKVAVHEIGHTLGLEHCSTPTCIMRDANGKVTSADDDYDLCAHCRGLIEKAGYSIPKSPKIPWPGPLQ